MNKNSNGKNGFTLIETIISICVIGIISVGLYGAYLLLIKNTKLAEEKQSVALVGKRTIENINNAIGNDKITLSGDNMVVKDLGLLKSEDASKNIDSLIMTGTGDKDKKKFTNKLYLDGEYNICKETDSNCVYEEEITIEKAKAKNGEEAEDIDIDMDSDVNKEKLEEDEEVIKKKINPIENEFSLSKEAGSNKSPEINKKSIPKEKNTLTLKVYIEKDWDNSVKISIKDSNENTLVEPISKNLGDTDFVNHLNLHFNFKEYKKEENETLKDLKINVFNSVDDTSKLITNIYIEKSVDLKVDAKATKGEINIFNRGDNKKIVKVGPLYNITVRIALKGQLSEENLKNLFTGYTNKNINIKENT